jgi:hypothetical protein
MFLNEVRRALTKEGIAIVASRPTIATVIMISIKVNADFRPGPIVEALTPANAPAHRRSIVGWEIPVYC